MKYQKSLFSKIQTSVSSPKTVKNEPNLYFMLMYTIPIDKGGNLKFSSSDEKKIATNKFPNFLTLNNLLFSTFAFSIFHF